MLQYKIILLVTNLLLSAEVSLFYLTFLYIFEFLYKYISYIGFNTFCKVINLIIMKPTKHDAFVMSNSVLIFHNHGHYIEKGLKFRLL